MASSQHLLDKVRPPRVQITYDVEIGNAIQKTELPFVMGVLADLAGTPATPLPSLKDRKFIEIDRDNINDVMASLTPQLPVRVQNVLGGKAPFLDILLSFNSLQDLNPLSIVKQVPLLNDLYTRRGLLSDLLSKLDGNDALDTQLRSIVDNPDILSQLQKSLKSSSTPAAATATSAPPSKNGASAPASSKGASAPASNPNLLGTIIQNGRLARDPSQTDLAQAMIGEFVNQVTAAAKGSAGNDVYSFIVNCISKIDASLSLQMDQIVHDAGFQTFEASWRGLAQLVMGTETGEGLKIKLLVLTKQELTDDLTLAVEFDQSQLFKKVYEEQYGTFGGVPFSCLMGDFEFGRDPQDIELATLISNVAACAHAPFITAAAPGLFNFDSFADLSKPRDLSKVFDGTDAIKWQSFRATEDSRYFVLALPHVLMRLPYGNNTTPVEGFNYEEAVDGTDNSKFCWGNAAYSLSQNITSAFFLYGWTAAIRGVENGGLVSNLPAYTFKTSDGDLVVKCPTEVAITDRREKELSDLGFMALCYCKHTDYAAFFGAQTAQLPKLYNENSANANARLSARLSYMLTASRFAHYIKVIMRDKIGSFMSRQDVSLYLNTWIAQYILLSDIAPDEIKASFPLREARIDVVDVEGSPGNYKAVIFLRPFFQLEGLTVSIRLVAALPRPGAV